MSDLEGNYRRIMLAAFCKLVSFNIPRMQFAKHVLKFYLREKRDFGDILKTTLQRCREKSKVWLIFDRRLLPGKATKIANLFYDAGNLSQW